MGPPAFLADYMPMGPPVSAAGGSYPAVAAAAGGGGGGLAPRGVAGMPAARNLFGPPGPTGTDFAQAVHRAMALGHLGQFMAAPQNLANQLNASFDRRADRNLVHNNQRLQELSLRLRDRNNRRLIDAIRESLGGGGNTGGPIPEGAIQSANAALRNVSPAMATPYLTHLMNANLRKNAPDLERTLTPANRSLGLAMQRQRMANAAPLLGLMR
jgi:hypothetical protein